MLHKILWPAYSSLRFRLTRTSPVITGERERILPHSKTILNGNRVAYNEGAIGKVLMRDIGPALQLLTSALFGALVGIERQCRHKNAGLKTNALASFGATSFG